MQPTFPFASPAAARPRPRNTATNTTASTTRRLSFTGREMGLEKRKGPFHLHLLGNVPFQVSQWMR